MLRRPVAEGPEDRRVEDAIQALERRLTPQRTFVQVDLGTAGTSGTFSIKGLAWVRPESVLLLALTTAAQGAAGLRLVASSINKGEGASGVWYSTSSIGGIQRIGVLGA